MDVEESAVAMVNYFTNCVAQLRERSVYVQFSNHKELKTDQTHSNASASAQAAFQAAQALIGQDGGGGGGLSGGSMSPKPHGVLPQTKEEVEISIISTENTSNYHRVCLDLYVV